MNKPQGEASMTVQDVVQQIVAVLDEHGGELSSEALLTALESGGVDSASVSTAVAYAVQEGEVDLDWTFNVHKRTKQLA